MMYFNRRKQHYYKIDVVCAYFKNNPESMDYLQTVIERSAPDYFHWTDIEIANSLMEGENK